MGKGRLAGTPLIVDNFRRLPPNHGVQYIFFLTRAWGSVRVYVGEGEAELRRNMSH